MPAKIIQISAPGKTFVAGEYLALLGGPSLVFTSEPRFHLKAKEGQGEQNPFHPESPAGKLFEREKEFFSQYELDFQDPYHGKGGMGASSAAFALLHSLLQWRDQFETENQKEIDMRWLLDDYRSLAHSGQGMAPSGADVVAQICGGLTYFDRNNGKVQNFAWPFKNLSLVLYATGVKLATHEHLKEIKNFETHNFEKAMAQVQAGLSHVDEELFTQGLSLYADELCRQNLQSEATLRLISQIKKWPGVKVVKGCGAMGADVIAVVFDHSQMSAVELKSKMQDLKLDFRADQTAISYALQGSQHVES